MKKFRVDCRTFNTGSYPDCYFCVLVDDCIVMKAIHLKVALKRARCLRFMLPDSFDVSIARVWKV